MPCLAVCTGAKKCIAPCALLCHLARPLADLNVSGHEQARTGDIQLLVVAMDFAHVFGSGAVRGH